MDTPKCLEPVDAREAFRICREEIKHEYGVLASRLTSYITSQSFLVSAYAVAMNNANHDWGATFRLNFALILSTMGVVLSIRAYPGIWAVCDVIRRWHDWQDELLNGNPTINEYPVLERRHSARANQKNLWFAQTSTWIFGIAWVLMAALTTWLDRLQWLITAPK